MNKQQATDIYLRVVTKLIEAEIGFFAEVSHSEFNGYHQIRCYQQDVEKALSMRLGFERKKMTTEKDSFDYAELYLPTGTSNQDRATIGAFN